MNLPALVVTAVLVVTTLAGPAWTADRPNVVILFVDDMGYADIGCFGAEGYETPNLDRMAREGMRFTSFYSASPACARRRRA